MIEPVPGGSIESANAPRENGGSESVCNNVAVVCSAGKSKPPDGVKLQPTHGADSADQKQCSNDEQYRGARTWVGAVCATVNHATARNTSDAITVAALTTDGTFPHESRPKKKPQQNARLYRGGGLRGSSLVRAHISIVAIDHG